MGRERLVSVDATCVFTHVGSARAAGSGTKRRGATGGGSADGGANASVAAVVDAPAEPAKGKSKWWQRVAVAPPPAVPAAAAAAVALAAAAPVAAAAAAVAAAATAAAVAAAATAAAAEERRARGAPLVPRGPKLTNRGTGLAPLWGRRRSQGVRKRRREMHRLYVQDRRLLRAQV